jgi:hypothetical protein
MRTTIPSQTTGFSARMRQNNPEAAHDEAGKANRVQPMGDADDQGAPHRIRLAGLFDRGPEQVANLWAQVSADPF